MLSVQKSIYIFAISFFALLFTAKSSYASCSMPASGGLAALFTGLSFCSVLFFITALLLEYKNLKSKDPCVRYRPAVMMRLCLGFGYSLAAGSIYFIGDFVKKIFDRTFPIEAYAAYYPYNKFYMTADYYDTIAAVVAAPVAIVTLFVLFALYKKKAGSPLNYIGLLVVLFYCSFCIWNSLQITPYFFQETLAKHKTYQEERFHDLVAVHGCPSRVD
ncbi:MAG: hypothetical protein Q8K65_05670 [Alphaproteobacteria bacterium]|nr:hypothetical protein [Alphaproteobacteria bacterium]